MNKLMTQEEALSRLLNMNLTDSFLLQKVIANKDAGENISRVILETILRRKLGNIRVSPEMIFPGVTEKTHGTRFDVYIEESADATFDTVEDVFDLEAENRKAKRSTLPKRVRFYRAKADSTHLPSGEEYDLLPDMYVIIVATFDPFGFSLLTGFIFETAFSKNNNCESDIAGVPAGNLPFMPFFASDSTAVFSFFHSLPNGGFIII